MINSEIDNKAKLASKEEVDAALDKIFNSFTSVITTEKERKKISLEVVDETLAELFDAINSARVNGKQTKIPDFRRILTDED